MVSNYSDAGQERWLATNGIELLRGSGRLAGAGVVEVDGVRHTAEARRPRRPAPSRCVPPVPGLRELDGVWTNREATGMKAVPRRLLVLGGGPVGVEMAQAVRRLGGEVALVEAAEHLLAREPAPLGEALGEVLQRRRDRARSRRGRERRAPRRRGLRPRARRRPRAARRPLAGRHRPAAARRRASASRPSASQPDAHGVPVDAHLRVGERLWAIGDVTGIWPLTHVGKYQGDVVAANILGEPREANYEAVPRVVYTDPQAAAVGATEARFSATAPISGVAKIETYTRAYAESNGFLTLLSATVKRSRAPTRSGPRPASGCSRRPLAIRAQLPLDGAARHIQPFPTFSEIYVAALKALRAAIAAGRGPLVSDART